MKLFNVILLSFLQIILLTGSFILLSAVMFVYYCASELPDYRILKDDNLPSVSRVYAQNNLLLSEFFYEYRIFVPINYIPKILKDSFIAVEDKNFYSNSGIDLLAILRSFIHNIRNSKTNNLVGGSTITQQVVKNFLLNNEKSLKRKVKEAILAFRISRAFSKDRVMELYLNKIYFGHGTYGIVAASLKYFNKSIDELNLEEIALLAALPQAPSRLDPLKNKKAIKERRNWVLNRMLEESLISQEDCIRAQESPIEVSNTKLLTNNLETDFFTDEIKRFLSKKLGENMLYEGGLFIRSTLVSEYQAIAENAVISGLRSYDRSHIGWKGPLGVIENAEEKDEKELMNELKIFPVPSDIKEYNMAVVLNISDSEIGIGLLSGEKSFIPAKHFSWIYKAKNEPSVNEFRNIRVGDIVVVNKIQDTQYYSLEQIPKLNGSLVMIDSSTGKVLAMVGGYDYSRSQFNVATQAKRQPGSVFKPFVYLASLENNFTPSTVINDEEIEIEQGPFLSSWRPRNYKDNFYGLITLRNALELSQNTATVQVARVVGIDNIIDVAKRFNIYQNNIKRNYAMALGANEVSLLNITAAYAMLANGGIYVEPKFFDFVSNSKGEIILSDDKIFCERCRVDNDDFLFMIPPELTRIEKRIANSDVVSQIVWLLRGSVQRGTSGAARAVGKTIAAKTGTSNDGVDNWFIGFWQNIVVGVYVGFDNPQTLGKDATGARVALPIFNEFMKNVLKKKNDKPIKLSESLSFVPVVKKTGLAVNSDTENSEIIFEAFQKDTEQIHEDFVFDDILTRLN